MNQFISSIFAIVSAVSLVAFSNSENRSSKFACTWFIYDDPAIVGTSECPPSKVQAKDQLKYKRLAPGESLATLCPGTMCLCAICVENSETINGVERPIIFDQIAELVIDRYFETNGNDHSRVDYPSSIKEKNTY